MRREDGSGAQVPRPIDQGQAAPTASRTVEFTIHGPMISASGDAAERKYHLRVGKSGRRWVIADQPDAAENIYVDGGKGSQGMAGRTLTFALVDGTTVDFIGPWKTGADGLFKDTGVDVRNTYASRGVVSFGREFAPWGKPDKWTDVQHFDEAPVIGAYDRIEKIAQQIADQSGRTTHYAYISKGGGSAFRCEPRASKARGA